MRCNIIPAFIIGMLAFTLFRQVYLRCSLFIVRVVLIIAAMMLTVPAVLFASNYVLLIPYASWFREFHALPGAEISAGLVGGLLGVMFASAKLRPGPLNRSILLVFTVIVIALILTPFAKQLFFCLDYSSLRNEWLDGVCIQTSGYTCLPASTATVVRTLGGKLTEPQLARAVGTTCDGTEIWYFMRALRKRGYELQFRHLKSFRDAPVPSVVGVEYSSSGHAVALLRRDAGGVELGDPLNGRRYYKWSKLPGGYSPNGFCVVIKKLD